MTLVTGGARFIGSHISGLRLQRDYDVRILDSLETLANCVSETQGISHQIFQSFGWEQRTRAEQIASQYIDWTQNQPEVSDYYANAERVIREAGVFRRVYELK